MGKATSASLRLSSLSSPPAGSQFWIHVQCVGNNGVRSQGSSSPVLVVDPEASLGSVQLGPVRGDGSVGDITYVNDTHFLMAWFDRFPLHYDAGLQFQWAFGVTPYGAELSAYRQLHVDCSLTDELRRVVANATLDHLHTYFVTVVAQVSSQHSAGPLDRMGSLHQLCSLARSIAWFCVACAADCGRRDVCIQQQRLSD